jgi:hypothetical protein
LRLFVRVGLDRFLRRQLRLQHVVLLVRHRFPDLFSELGVTDRERRRLFALQRGELGLQRRQDLGRDVFGPSSRARVERAREPLFEFLPLLPDLRHARRVGRSFGDFAGGRLDAFTDEVGGFCESVADFDGRRADLLQRRDHRLVDRRRLLKLTGTRARRVR